MTMTMNWVENWLKPRIHVSWIKKTFKRGWQRMRSLNEREKVMPNHVWGLNWRTNIQFIKLWPTFLTRLYSQYQVHDKNKKTSLESYATRQVRANNFSLPRLELHWYQIVVVYGGSQQNIKCVHNLVQYERNLLLTAKGVLEIKTRDLYARKKKLSTFFLIYHSS